MADRQELIERLEAMAEKEARFAGGVQGPGVRGTEWGADIIAKHRRNAETLRRAAAALRDQDAAPLTGPNSTHDLIAALRLCIQRIERPNLSPDANVVLERAYAALGEAEGQG